MSDNGMDISRRVFMQAAVVAGVGAVNPEQVWQLTPEEQVKHLAERQTLAERERILNLIGTNNVRQTIQLGIQTKDASPAQGTGLVMGVLEHQGSLIASILTCRHQTGVVEGKDRLLPVQSVWMSRAVAGYPDYEYRPKGARFVVDIQADIGLLFLPVDMETLALWGIPTVEEVKMLKTFGDDPSDWTKIQKAQSLGYPAAIRDDPKYKHKVPLVREFSSPGQQRTWDVFVNGVVAPGDSGSPVFCDGMLVGIATGMVSGRATIQKVNARILGPLYKAGLAQ